MDALVHDSYGPTEGEIAIVEGRERHDTPRPAS
jgi:hypothetical protein